MILTALILLGASTVVLQQPALTDANGIVARMMERDAERQQRFEGYSSMRRYVLENPSHHKRAEMVVRMTCRKDGVKEFEVVSSQGWSAARKHVFPRVLDGEAESSLPSRREQSRITLANYMFTFVGTAVIESRATYILDVTPRSESKYLIRGRIWVDSEDYAVVRIEGQPAKNPSFWIKSVRFQHRYEKHGPNWLPSLDRSVTDARFFGATEVTIEYLDYTEGLNPEVSLTAAHRGGQ